MGKAKVVKKAAKSSKATAKKAVVKTKSATRAKKVVPVALSTEQKQRLLKPLTGFGELVERLVTVWKEHGRQVKLPGMTPAKFSSLLRKAERANQKEDALRAAFEAKIQPLADERLRTEHELWKGALDLHAMVKASARMDPAIAKPFEFFADALAKRRAGGKNGEG